jgi:uncharacterized membrane protein
VPGSIFEFLFKYRPLVFREGRLTFESPLALAVLVPAVVLLAAIAVWTYRRVGGKATARDRTVLSIIRVATLAVIAFSLLRPALLVSNVVPQQNYVGVLVDDSRSMRITDNGDAPRSGFVGQELGAESDLIRRLEDRFQLRYYRFSANAERVPDVAGLDYSGTRTRIAPALDRVREELAPVPLSGLVVITDGADNAAAGLTETLLALKAAQVPVYTVGLGRERYDKDIELSRVSTPRQVLKGASLVVDLLVSQSGYAGEKVNVVVEDEGSIVGSQEVELPGDGEPVPVRVHFTADQAGPRRFTFRVPAQEGELVLENNEQDALIDVRDNTIKILYFEGEPRPEVKFTRRAIEEEKNLQLVVLMRSAEDKYWRGSIDSAQELEHGFPRTRDELFRYQGLILGTVEASAFTHEQMRMIADFVSERGGGLLTLGGRHSYAQGGYVGTPVAEALPVEIETSYGTDTTFFDSLRITPTRAGLANPVAQIAPTEDASAKAWETLPRLTTPNPLGSLKPGATALLVGKGDHLNDQPVLAWQRYGRGLAVSLGVQDTWLWQMVPPLEDMTHETFWRQMLRWLVSATPDQVTVTLPADRAAPGESVRIIAEVDDEAFLRVNNSSVIAHVTRGDGTVEDIPLDWTIEQDGEYQGAFTPSSTGLYRIDVEATTPAGALKARPTFINIEESRSEYFGSQLNKSLLQRIARETGGRYYTPATVRTLPEDLSITGRGSTVIEEKELWDMPILLVLVLSLMAAEWLFRRRKGLA